MQGTNQYVNTNVGNKCQRIIDIEMDNDKIFTIANYSHHDITHHVSKLISTFNCSKHHINFLFL